MPTASGIKIRTMPAIVVVTAGVAVPIHATPLFVYAFSLQSLDSNSGIQYFGDSLVTSSNGMLIRPGDVIEGEPPASARGVDQFDLSKVFVNSSEDGAEFRVVAWIRE